MENASLTEKSTIGAVVKEIRLVLDVARDCAARQVNNELLNAYWSIDRIICEYEQTVP